MRLVSFIERATDEDSFVDSPSSSPKLFFEKKDGGLIISIINKIESEVAVNEIVIDNNIFKPRSKYMICLSNLYGLKLVDHDFLYKSKDNWAYMDKAFLLGEVVANIYFHDTLDTSIFFSNRQPYSVDVQFEAIGRPVRIHDWIAEQYPGEIIAPAHNANLRFEIFNDINTIDSIVALEQQVDVLTHIVKSILPLVDKSQIPDWADSALSSFEENSTAIARGFGEIISDSCNHKAKVRQKQITYLEKKA